MSCTFNKHETGHRTGNHDMKLFPKGSTRTEAVFVCDCGEIKRIAIPERS